jgi:hypothetical protein
MRSREDDEDDAMDWTPTTITATTASSSVRPPGLGLGLFGPGPGSRGTRTETDATTGLETLLERTNIDSSEPRGVSARTRRRGGVTDSTSAWSWGWVYALSLVPLIGIMYYQLFR